MSEEKQKRKRNVINKTIPLRRDNAIDRVILEYFEEENTPFAPEAKLALYQHVMTMRMMKMNMHRMAIGQMAQAMMPEEMKNKA